MKTFSIITALLFVANLTMAQSSAQTVANVSINNETSESKKSVHGQMAIEQISNHVLEYIQYPASVRDYGFDGKLMLEVTLASDGVIKKAAIVKSSNSKSMDKATIYSLSSLKRIDIGSIPYQGAQVIRIPLSFKIER